MPCLSNRGPQDLPHNAATGQTIGMSQRARAPEPSTRGRSEILTAGPWVSPPSSPQDLG